MQFLMTVLYILLFIVLLSVLIIVHELGHLVAAKAFNVYCLEYSVAIDGMFLDQRVESARGVEVDDGYRPNVGGLLDTFHIGVEPLSYLVGVCLRGLDVFLIAIEISSVDGCDKHHLLGGEHLLEALHGNVDASPVGVLVH